MFQPEVGNLIFQAGDVVGGMTVLEKALAEEARRDTALSYHPIAIFLYESTKIPLDVRFEGAVLVFRLLERDG